MKFCGIICEFNPLHNGHKYLIEQAKKITNLPIICVMSGNFSQRAEPTILDKHTRANNAISAGADIVIELPTCFAINNAETFAKGAITILEKLGNVQYLCFGSECGDVKKLQNVVNIFEKEAKKLDTLIKYAINDGKSYPSALEKAFQIYCKNNNITDLSPLLKQPNNILGIEYLKQISKHNSDIIPLTIKRIGEAHKSQHISKFCSASVIRKISQNSLEEIRNFVPEYTFNSLQNLHNSTFISQYELLKIKTTSPEQLEKIYEVNEGLEYRFDKEKEANNLEELIEKIKTKRYTHNKIRRIVLNNTLGITKDLMKNEFNPYATILAISNKKLLKELQNITTIFSKRDCKKLDDSQKIYFEIDLLAETLYNIK